MPTDEESKAIQEVAKTTGQSVEAARDLGNWFAKLMGESLEATFGMLSDSLKVRRWKRQVELAESVQEIWHRFKTGDFRPVPPKFLCPLVENAALEDSDELRILYARLLASASDSSMPSPRTGFSEIIRQMEPIDAVIVRRLYVFYLNLTGANDLPDDVDIRTDFFPKELSISPLQFRVSFDNLRRLGLVDSFFESKTFEDLESNHKSMIGSMIKLKSDSFFVSEEDKVSHHGGYSNVRMTALGVEFMLCACYGDPEIAELRSEAGAKGDVSGS